MKQDEKVNFLIAFKQKHERVSVEIRNDANELITYINPITCIKIRTTVSLVSRWRLDLQLFLF